MLKNKKQCIYLCMFFLILAFLVILMIFDIKRLYYQNGKKHQEILENSILAENLYIQVSKKFQDSNIKNEQLKSKKELVSKIDIYSTNPWRIKIPKLRLDAPITEGTSAESLRRTVGHFEETDKWKGNVALAGHNRGYRCNFFQEIKNLEKGDIIIYCTKKGERKYQVVVNTVIKETDWKYIQNTKDNRITLITCEKNKREYRRCIQAVEIKNI